MSKEDMVKAREFIKQKRFDDARAVLRKTNHPQAAAWLAKLDEIDPPVVDPEATLIEARPVATETGATSPAPMVDNQPVKKEEREIPLPLALGCIGLVLLTGVCIIGAFLIYSNLQESLVTLSDPVQAPDLFQNSTTISYGASVNGRLSNGNNFEESWVFTAAQGDQIVITMRSSEVDSLLYLHSANGNLLAENDDDGGGVNGYDSEINYTIPEDGQYIIVANQWFEGEGGGSYTLTLQRQ